MIENTKGAPGIPKEAIANVYLGELKTILQVASEKALLIESLDDFEEKREDEKNMMITAQEILKGANAVIGDDKGSGFYEVVQEYYGISNWLIRNSMLKFEFEECKAGRGWHLGKFMVAHIADKGEKYDMNLLVASDILQVLCEKGQVEGIKEQAWAVVERLNEKEALRKNVDVISNQLKK